MAVVEESMQHGNQVAAKLRELIDVFEHLNLDERLKRSKVVLDAMTRFFEDQGGIMHQVYKRRPDYRSEFETFDEAHRQLLQTFEDMVLMHVEEPDYYAELRQLQSEFSVYVSEHYKQFMAKVDTDFSRADEARVSEKIA